MLFVHEVHTVVGKRADQFEDAYRHGWMPILAEGSDARLLWYFDHAHGSGPAYRVVTVTGGGGRRRLVPFGSAGGHRRPAGLGPGSRRAPA